MNWKVGDKYWVDYHKMEEQDYPIRDWKTWFPPENQPFTVHGFYDNGVVTDEYIINFKFVKVDKNKIVTDILNDL